MHESGRWRPARWALLLLVALTGLGGCATTRLVGVEATATGAAPFQRLLVLGPPAMAARAAFETALVAGLETASGSTALAGSARLPDGALIDAGMLTEVAREAGADGVLTVVPANITVIRHRSPLAPYYPLGHGRYRGFYPFYDPFYDPVPAMRFQVLRLEMRLYPLAGRRPVWRAFSETIDPTTPPALADQLAARLAADLIRRGLLPAPTAGEATDPS